MQLDYDDDRQVDFCPAVGDSDDAWITSEDFMVDNNNGDATSSVMSIQHRQHQQHQTLKSAHHQQVAYSIAPGRTNSNALRYGSHCSHSVTFKQHHICLYPYKHCPGGASTHIHIANTWVQLTTHLSTPRGWMAELAMLADMQRTVYPEEVIRQLHVMAQARESSPVRPR